MDIREYAQKLKHLSENTDKLMNRVANQTGLRMMTRVKKLTPVGVYPKESGKVGGTLRRGWKMKTQKHTAIVFNNVEYASFVENGHLTADRKKWINGQFFMRRARQETEKEIENIAKQEIKRWLKE